MVKNSSFPTGYRLFTKGAAENAMMYSDKYIDKENGQIYEINNDIKKYINHKIDKLNKKMIRSLYVCYKDISKEEFENGFDIGERGLLIDQLELVFIGIFGLKDSLRQEVKESVDKCHDASVNVIMVTGDNIITATSIAKECHILPNTVDLNDLKKYEIEKNPNEINNPELKQKHIESLLINQPYSITGNSFYEVIGGIYCETCNEDTQNCKCPKTKAEAEELSKKSGEEIKKIKKDAIKNIENFKKITKNLLVLARSQPLQKYALVLGLKTLGNVVAVTGDGTNDAPSLSKSDVGFAMIEGTDIAKEASDIVILDNNFSSIVIAIIYGRSIYENIRKFLQFQLTVNFCACILVFICSCIGNETPLNSIQMLWVNLIMDSLGSLALATEPPYEELLQREPTRRNESMINGRMWKHIIIQSLVQIILLVIMYLIAPEFIKEDDLMRAAENRLIKFCYTDYPGKDTDHIIYGTEVKWTTKGKLKNQYKAYCGNYASRSNLFEAYTEYHNSVSATTHMTLIFNIFVFYTLFNQINCRVIDDSVNIFVRITRSLLFPLICIVEMALQVLIIFIGKSPFHIVNDGLSGTQWGICIGFSAITFVVSFIVKFIPIHICIDRYLDKKIQKEEEEELKQEESEALNESGVDKAKVDIGKRKMTRHISKRSARGSSNQINIYNMKKSG
jgi:Ca2+ transporting ATPase